MRAFHFISAIVVFASCNQINIQKETDAGIRQYENDSIVNAINTLSKVISKTDTCYACYLYRGFAYKKLKKYDNAIKDFTSLINLDKNDGVGFANRASVYYQMNDYLNSLRDFQRAFYLDTTQTILYHPISHMLFATGQKDSACYYYFKSIENGDTTFNQEIMNYCSKKE